MYQEAASIVDFQNKLMQLKPFDYMGQKVLFKTFLFGKEYYWMLDGDGTHYLVKCDDDGFPDFT